MLRPPCLRSLRSPRPSIGEGDAGDGRVGGVGGWEGGRVGGWVWKLQADAKDSSRDWHQVRRVRYIKDIKDCMYPTEFAHPRLSS